MQCVPQSKGTDASIRSIPASNQPTYAIALPSARDGRADHALRSHDHSALATIWVWAVWRTLDTLARHLDGFAPFIVAVCTMLPLALWLALSMSASPAASLS